MFVSSSFFPLIWVICICDAHTNLGNSNSVANLVENENPTSMQSVPLNDDMLPNMDTDTLGNLTPFNNMKGSYNNLFCDNLDDDTNQTFDQTDPVNVQNTSKQILENVYSNISTAMQTQPNGNKNTIESSTVNMATNHIVDNLLTSTDPNLHVYSNVSNTKISETEPSTATPTTATSITTNATPKITNDILTMAENNSIQSKKSKLNPDTSLNVSNIESIISQSIKSSKLLSDNLNDLDLDDPTLVSGSIVNTPNTSTMSKVLKTNESIGLSNSKFNSNKKTTASDESRLTISKKLFNDTATSLDGMVDGENGNGSYLRSLHDTTMIDTALDLDSIEDANISIENVS